MSARANPDSARPLVVLVQEESILRLWMERKLSEWFRVCVFSAPADALAFTRSAARCDVLITDIDLGLPTLGGCYIARDVRSRFPGAQIFVFSNTGENDHRLVLLRGMQSVVLLTSRFAGLFIVKRIRAALAEKDGKRGQ